jgi:hypothetical protein
MSFVIERLRQTDGTIPPQGHEDEVHPRATSKAADPCDRWTQVARCRSVREVLRIAHMSDLHVLSPHGFEWRRILLARRSIKASTSRPRTRT